LFRAALVAAPVPVFCPYSARALCVQWADNVCTAYVHNTHAINDLQMYGECEFWLGHEKNIAS
jgi:hypothetical protein